MSLKYLGFFKFAQNSHKNDIQVKQEFYPPLLGIVGDKKWSPFLDLGVRSPIFLNSWQGWIFGRVQNCLRPPPPSVLENHIAIFFSFTDLNQEKGNFLGDHLQEAGPSEWSFARGRSGPRGLTPPLALPNLTEDFFSKCLNVVKNENVLLDPNSEALCPYGLPPFADNSSFLGVYGQNVQVSIGNLS